MYDYEHTRRSWKELGQILLVVGLFALLVWLLGPRWAIVAVFLGSVLYSLLIA